MKNNRIAIGIVCAFFGAVFWGYSGTAIQYLQATYPIQPNAISLVRMVFGSLILIALAWPKHHATMRAMLHDRVTVGRLFVFGIALYLCQVVYIVAIHYSNSGTATVLQTTNVVIVMLAVCVHTHRRPVITEIAGVACALAAVVLVATKGEFGTLAISTPGLLWGMGTAITAALYTAYPAKLFEQWGSLPGTALGLAFGSIPALAVAAFQTATGTFAFVPPMDTLGIINMAGIVLVGTVAAFGLFLHGVALIGSVRGSQLSAVEPLSATILSAMFLGTAFTWADWLGLALIIATVFLVTVQHTPAPAANPSPSHS